MSPSQPLVLFQMLHSHFRANALYCLLAQAKCSLMVQEKQMPLLAALVFLLDSLYLKPIPHSPDSLNILRLCCIKLDLLSYLFNMHCYSGNISNGFHIPDFGEKLFFCKYMVGILCQEGKQVEFLGCKGLFFPVYPPRISMISFAGWPLPTRRSYLAIWAFTLATISLGLNGLVM